MAITIKTIKCPECGASLDIEEGRNQCFCTYCGCKIALSNENEYIYRHIDEAEVKFAEAEAKHAETEQILKLKQVELEKQKYEDKQRQKKTRAKIRWGLLVVALVLMLFRNYTNLYNIGLLLLLFIVPAVWGIHFLIWLFTNNDKKD